MFLEKAVESARARVSHTRVSLDQDTIRQWASPVSIGGVKHTFEDAVGKAGLSLIAECKKASPSAGDILGVYSHKDTALDFAAAGADAISVLTEPDFFKGSGDHLRDISSAVKTPCLRRDFIVDEYQLYEAKLLGASALTLVCAALDDKLLARFIQLSAFLGIAAVAEVHNENELNRALAADARVICVSRRDIETFRVDDGLAGKLRPLVPKDRLFIADGGIHSREDVERLAAIGADAVIIGEALLKANDRAAKAKELMGRN